MKLAHLIRRLLPPIWFGMVAAIAIESYLKFQAPGITRELGLGIGKLVFVTLNRIEIGIGLVLAIAVFALPVSKIIRTLIWGLGVILVLQTFWLIPALVIRIDEIVGGQTPHGPSVHLIYIVLEMVKLLFLLGLSIYAGLPVREAE